MLWDLPNVILTPHVAGALGNELVRLRVVAVDEVLLALAGRPLRHPGGPGPAGDHRLMWETDAPRPPSRGRGASASGDRDALRQIPFRR